jgi:hypothetical protein
MAITLLDRPVSGWGRALRGSRVNPAAAARPAGPAPARGAVVALTRRTPATAVYLLVLAGTTFAAATSSDRTAFHLLLKASTNLRNMTSHPVRVLVSSAFWVESTTWFWPTVALVAVVMGGAEVVLGTRRTLVAFAAGHVCATVLTVGAIGVGVARGLLPHDLAHALDVGPSYGLAALGGVLVTRASRRWQRRAGAGALLAGLGVAMILDGDFTDAGHLIAASVGLLVGHVVIHYMAEDGGFEPPRVLPQHGFQPCAIGL